MQNVNVCENHDDAIVSYTSLLHNKYQDCPLCVAEQRIEELEGTVEELEGERDALKERCESAEKENG